MSSSKQPTIEEYGDHESLAQRLRRVEGRQAIYQIVCGYGYAVDGCNAAAVGAFYAEDGSHSVSDIGTFQGHEQIASIADQPAHHALVDVGYVHLSTLPHVVIKGDRAIATCHTLLIKHGKDGFRVDRLSASRLELSRGSHGGWRIDHRQNQVLNGGSAGPALLARLNEGPNAGEGA